jgi:hypothetical protein
MRELEQILGLFVAAVILAAAARRVGAPYPVFLALGAIVAPLDAVAATAVLRPLRPPHRILTILEGESLLNDASALLIYRLAVGAVAANGFSVTAVAPTFLLAVAGSLVAGPALGWLVLRLMERVQHVPTAIILQFVGRELRAARERALRAGLASLGRDQSPVAELVRQEFTARLAYERSDANRGDATHSAHSELLHGALQAARQAVLAMRANDEIGDDAFHRIEEELDWLEMAGGRKGE